MEVVCYVGVPWLILTGAHICDDEAPLDHEEKPISEAELERMASQGTQRGGGETSNNIGNEVKAKIL